MLLQASQGNSSTAALIISLISLGVSLVTLIWKFLEWRFAGARIKVTCAKVTIVDDDSRGALFLRARNRGRTATSVEQWGFLLPDREYGPASSWKSGPATPARLEPHSSGAWAMDYDEARRHLAEFHPNPMHFWDVRPYVLLGSGDRVISRSALRVWEVGYVGSEPPLARWRRLFWRQDLHRMEPGTNQWIIERGRFDLLRSVSRFFSDSGWHWN